MKKIQFVARFKGLAFGVVLLAGCVPHLTEQQCKSMNWYDRGYNDGTRGELKRDLSRDISDCAKFNIDVSVKGYTRGWEAGLRIFCRPGNGFQLGINGQTYHRICPLDLAPEFEHQWRRGLRQYCIPETGYNLGRAGKPYPNFCAANQIVGFRNAYDSGYRIYQSIRSIQTQIDNTNAELDNLALSIRHKQRDIDHWNRDLVNAKGPEKKGLRDNIEEAERQMSELNRRMNNLNQQRDRLQIQLNKQNARP